MTHQQAIDGMASERYLLDEMSEPERFEFEAHYFDCPECAEDVRLGHLIREEATAKPSAKILPFWKRPMVAVPWAAAAALALVVGYQSLASRESIGPEPLAPVMLRGATRGTIPVVTIAPNQHFVTLAVDLMPPSQPRALRYELRRGQTSVLSGDAPLPAAGMPLMLLLPAAELERGAQYSLIIHSADAVIGEYNFDVS
jgi:hypothetical protein